MKALNSLFINLKPLLSYVNEQFVTSQKVNLSIYLTNHLASFILFDALTNQPARLSFFKIDNWSETTVASFIGVCNESEAIGTVHVAFSTDRHAFLPISKFDAKALQQHLNTTFPFSPYMEFQLESYADTQFYLGYQVPAVLLRGLTAAFPNLQFRHAFKPLLYKVSNQGIGGAIYIDITIEQMNIAVYKADQLLFCGTRSFTTEQDALFILLKACQDYLLQNQEVQLHISGLIEANSNLFNELSQYFLQIQFRDNELSWDSTSFPAHYFTQLTNNLLCVS